VRHFFTRWRRLGSHDICHQNWRGFLLNGIEYPNSSDNRAAKENREECDQELLHAYPFMTDRFSKPSLSCNGTVSHQTTENKKK
jgi:hypothetical protein